MSVSVCLRYLPLARYIRCNRLSILLCDLVLERIEKWKREEQMWKKNDSVKKIQEKYLQRAKRRREICEKQNIGRRRKARVELEEKRLESTGKENVSMTDSWKKFVRGKVQGRRPIFHHAAASATSPTGCEMPHSILEQTLTFSRAPSIHV